jgi:hypothetical protein
VVLVRHGPAGLDLAQPEGEPQALRGVAGEVAIEIDRTVRS